MNWMKKRFLNAIFELSLPANEQEVRHDRENPNEYMANEFDESWRTINESGIFLPPEVNEEALKIDLILQLHSGTECQFWERKNLYCSPEWETIRNAAGNVYRLFKD